MSLIGSQRQCRLGQQCRREQASLKWINVHRSGSRKTTSSDAFLPLRRAVSSSPRPVAETGRRVPWNYNPDDVYQAVETGCIADVKQDGFFPASIEVHKLRTTTHTYSTPFAVHVNCHFLSPVTRHQSLVPIIVRFAKLFTFYVHSFPLRAHSCTSNHLITGLVAHSYLPNRTITTFYA